MAEETARQKALRLNDNEAWKRCIKTPRVGVAAVVESRTRDRIVLIERKYPPYGLAFPGGFMDLGETFAETGCREVKEETGLIVEPVGLLNVTSGTDLDPRMHLAVVAAVFRVAGNTSEDLNAGDDALKAKWLVWKSSDGIEPFLTPRSKLIMTDYKDWRGTHAPRGAPAAPLR
jgi:8-oxo-dGTP diphosphatase